MEELHLSDNVLIDFIYLYHVQLTLDYFKMVVFIQQLLTIED